MVISLKLGLASKLQQKVQQKTDQRSERTWWMGIFLPTNLPYKSAFHVGPILWILWVIYPTELYFCISNPYKILDTLRLGFLFSKYSTKFKCMETKRERFRGIWFKLIQNHHLLGFVLGWNGPYGTNQITTFHHHL